MSHKPSIISIYKFYFCVEFPVRMGDTTFASLPYRHTIPPIVRAALTSNLRVHEGIKSGWCACKCPIYFVHYNLPQRFDVEAVYGICTVRGIMLKK